jgi:hypothetical protein
MLWNNVVDLLEFLPSVGPLGPLTSDLLDPTSSMSGTFGGEVVALRLNVDFSDADFTVGNLGIPFGELEIHGVDEYPLVNGRTVRQMLSEMTNVLGGGASIFLDLGSLTQIAQELNSSFGGAGGDHTLWAEDHLRLPTPLVSSNGDVITYTQGNWGGGFGQSGASLLAANFDAVYAPSGGVFFVGRGGLIGDSMQFTNAAALLNYLPASGPDGRLLDDYVNPTTTNAGSFGGEVAALKLNIDFAHAGILGDFDVKFGDLVLHSLTEANQIQFNGQTVLQFYGAANFSIGTPVVGAVSHLNAIAEELNRSFSGGYISSWAQANLRMPLPADFDEDGDVDSADLDKWKLGFAAATGATHATGDADNDAGADFLAWQRQFGRVDTFGSARASPSHALPELTLLLICWIWRSTRRRLTA